MASQRNPNRAPKQQPMTIGRDRFEKICAMEGIKLTLSMKERAADFDRRLLSPVERQREIINAHRKTADEPHEL